MRLAMLCLPLLLLAACAQQAPRDDGLYRALGAEPGIVRIVEGMLLGSARDPRIARHFLDIDIERLRDKLIEQLCFESGGPCVYTGDSMEESHKPDPQRFQRPGRAPAGRDGRRGGADAGAEPPAGAPGADA
jgi:hemoglobin